MTTNSSSEDGTDATCLGCLSFRGGMKLLFGWGVFWLWCWFMTSQFMWKGVYNQFNGGGAVTRSVPVIVVCTLLSLAAVVLTGLYLFKEDTVRTRFGLVVASGTMLAIAVVFVVGGVSVMWLDVVLMSYSLKKTHDEYRIAREYDGGLM